MSGLLALLDDVAAIAKMAAASVDDVVAAAAKAGAKTAGVVIDDAAVTPKYITGFSAERELPIIWRISLGSVKNKVLILLPALLALNWALPWLITPILMLGGAYLCFEGAEKVFHWLAPHANDQIKADFDTKDPAHLEEEKVAGAIKTDFILSAEIMTLALATVESPNLAMQAATLALVAVFITSAVYGAVALIVKMDDIGLHMAANAYTGAGRSFGRGLVVAMPKVMAVLSFVGTIAMLWVGGSIILHGLDVTHLWSWPYAQIHHIAEAAAALVGQAQGFVTWTVTAAIDGVIGLAVGLGLIPVVTKIITPIWTAITPKK